MADRTDADAARDLLLAMFALRHDRIDRDQLLAAFDVWAADPGRTMAEVLVGQGALDESGCVAMGEMIRRHRGRRAGMRRDVAAPAAASPLPETVAHVRSPAPAGGREAPDRLASRPIDERYRVVRPHARGGLGEVFLAIDPELDRQVALKELRSYHAHDPNSQARFLLEARLTGRLEHPGIVPVYGLGRYADGRPYYAMRLIEGETLGDAIRRFHAEEDSAREPGRREIAFRRLLRSLIDACNAVAYAHSRGVVHRDLKPDNIMLGRFGETLVVDWGLAKSLASAEAVAAIADRIDPVPGDPGSLTLPGAALGTPAYMSPEQASGDLDRVGPASDVYSLGATLYCLLVGHGPFSTGDVADVLERVRRGIFPAPRRLRRSIDPTLEAICLKAMATRPEDRYDSPVAMAEEIEAWLADVRYRAEQDRALGDARRSLARLAVERAGRLFERGMVADGMLWLARALENAPPDATGLERAVRASLGGWHAGPKAVERTLAHREGMRAVAFSPDGRRLLVGGADGTAQLWDVATGARLAPAMGHRGAIVAVAFSPDGRLAATSGDDGIPRLWDAVTGVAVDDPARRGATIAAVGFGLDGARIALDAPIGAVPWPGASMLGLDPDRRRIIAGCPDGRVRLWDAVDETTMVELPSESRAEAGCVAIAAAGRVAASTCPDGTARLWDVATGRPIGEPMGHRGPVDRLAFHPEGTIVATAGRDGTARLWDAATGLAIGPPLEHRGAVHDLAFSPDGRRLATASADGMARCWRVPAPVVGDVERITCWVRATTGREFDEGDAIRPIDPLMLWELRRLLQDLGGPPVKEPR